MNKYYQAVEILQPKNPAKLWLLIKDYMEQEQAVPSSFLYEGIMSEISKIQGDKSAIVILENDDGSTTYLRYKIDQEQMTELLRSAYSK